MVARILTLALGAVALSVCAAGQAQDEYDGSPRPAEPYVVGIEDKLMISVYKDPELSRPVKVRPDGKISLPIIQDVEVVGRTPAEIASILTAKLRDYFQFDPQVTVIVEEINSFRVYFLGEVSKQGPIQFYRPTRVLQAVATAGGPTEYAKKQITIIREADFGVRAPDRDRLQEAPRGCAGPGKPVSQARGHADLQVSMDEPQTREAPAEGAAGPGLPAPSVRPMVSADLARWNAYVLGHAEATFFHLGEWRTVLEPGVRSRDVLPDRRARGRDRRGAAARAHPQPALR